MPPITHQFWVRPLMKEVSVARMTQYLRYLTSNFFTRYCYSTEGERSSRWLHDQIAKIIEESPFKTYISLMWHNHPFPQNSIIARFESPVTNPLLPTTIIGAHQDSVNQQFPLLPAPGADDDGSGTVSILEAFRVLATHGYVPERGPVEFHWYAGEEGGLMGSLERASYAKKVGYKVGAMLQLDMTGYISAAAPEYMGILRSGSDSELTKWLYGLATNYTSLPVEYVDLPGMAGSDHMSWTRFGYPACAATEGNPMAGGAFPGHLDGYIHTSKDRMDVRDEKGVFSVPHMAKFSELAIAFVVEQAGWHTNFQKEAEIQALWS